MKPWKYLQLPAALLLGATALGGCAQDVDDIDRTQPNLVEKTDLTSHEWYVRQTVSQVPATSGVWFEGFTGPTEKIRFQFDDRAMYAYRSYELVPGSTERAFVDENGETVSSGVDEFNNDGSGVYLDAPLMMWNGVAHVDVQRSYNATTGEETNVISENTSDREWNERQYSRVDWADNVLNPLDFLGAPTRGTAYATFVSENEENANVPRFVYDDDGDLEYFDYVVRYIAEPDFFTCILYLNSIAVGDCAPQQIEVRYSFMRADEIDDYEPLIYDDEAMNRFGYFRTERLSYDRRRGTTVTGRIQLANRYDIWEDDLMRDAAGEPTRDEDGALIYRPISERTPKPIVYHLSSNFPQEEYLMGAAEQTARGWDRSYRRAVAAAQNDGDVSGWEDVQNMFVLCNNPVSDTPIFPADASYTRYCGDVGDEVKIGDLRYNVMWWVTDVQQSGPLGYGPSAPDPETGRNISGTAYVYGGSIDTYAQYAVDVVRFANGDLTPEDLQDPDYVRDQVLAGLQTGVDPRAQALVGSTHLNQPIRADVTELVGDAAALRIQDLRVDFEDGTLDTLRTGRGWDQRRNDMIADSGFDMLALNDEQLLAFGVDPTEALTDEDLQVARLSSFLNTNSPERQRLRADMLAEDCILEPDYLDDSILGIAEAFAGETNYDEMYYIIRGQIFQAVMEHEVGHTLGLRHNFSASWDSLNYHDEYWDLKVEGFPSIDDAGEAVVRPFGPLDTFADLYGIARLTPAQITGRMREFQYASIMDYSSAFNTDFGGVGKYDDQAILFAYTGGTDSEQEVRDGYVEVWENAPQGVVDILQQFETRRSPGFTQFFELYHYTTIASEFAPSGDAQELLTNLRDRSYMRLDTLEQQIEDDVAGRALEVPYMFCSDEYRGTSQMCRTWDRGADPMEQTVDYIDRYRRYYYFDYYRRDRLGFMQIFTSDVGQRIGGRIFSPLVDGYQRWLLGPGISGTPDPTLDNQWTFAAYAGLNLISEAITTPNYGSYVQAEDSLGREFFEFVSYGVSDNVDIYLQEGEGRRRFSLYGSDDGYYFYRFPDTAGHYWTMINAMVALTSSQTAVLGVQVGRFDTNYSIPPYLVFEDELTSLFNAIALDRNATFGPVATPEDGEFRIQSRPLVTLGLNNGMDLNPETGEEVEPGLGIASGDLDPALGFPIDVNMGFSEGVTAQILGLSSFTTNYGLRYVDQAHIWRLNDGNNPVVAPGFELVSFCDPSPSGTGLCFATQAAIDSEENTMALELVRRGQLFVEEYENGSGTALREIDSLMNDINIIMNLYTYFSNVI
ncbi:MAG: hypothetical protein ACI81R_000514 [Bradymonadia bacterium]|jgi:hypothetical protein